MRASDLVKDVVFIIGSGPCFRSMYLKLTEPALNGEEVSWPTMEAALFVMQAVARSLLS